MNTFTGRRIDLKYFMASLKKKGHQLIIVLIVGLVLGGCFSIVSGAAKRPAANAAAQKAVVETREALGAVEATQVDNVFSTYKALTNQFNSVKDYTNNSVKLNLDPKTSVGEELVYLVNKNKKISAISTAISALIVDDDLCNQINAKLSTKLDSSFIKELINVTIDNSNDDKQMTGSIDDQEFARSLIINIYASNDEQRKVFASCVKAKVNTVVKKMQATYGSFDCKIAADTQSKITEANLNKLKSDASTNLSSITSAITSLTSTLSVNQKTYFDALVTADQTTAAAAPTGYRVSVIATYAIGFGILFLILFVAIFMVVYLSSKKLHYGKELEQMFGAQLLAEIKDEDSLAHAIQELHYLVDHTNGQYAIVSTTKSEKMQSLLKKLSDAAQIDILPAMPETDKDYENMSHVQKLVIVEEDEISTLDAIESCIKYYNEKSIQIAAAITTE